MFPKWSDWNIKYTRKGLVKHKISQALRIVLLVAAIVGAYYIKKDIRGGLLALRTFSQQHIKSTLFSILGLVQRGIGMLRG